MWVNYLTPDTESRWNGSILALDDLALRNHDLKRRRSQRAVLTSVLKTLFFVVVAGSLWQLFESSIPYPSKLLSGDAASLLPLIPIAVGFWLMFDANRRDGEVDEMERDLIDAELDMLKRELGDH